MTDDAAASPGRAGNLLDEIVGPFWDADSVASHLSLRADELARKTESDQIIWVPLASGTPVFPAWQFEVDHGAQHKLLIVWKALRADADPWTCAVWICSPARDLDGQSVLDYLVGDPSDPHRLATVMDLVAVDTAGWRQ
ncbi:hypothetical protein TPB0596_00980 [Tsukamurella pulmonis]|uniref:hypothetical protein n=1 Tax=Tsukamurella pulmonis TaxID=47312 RepID=UPI001EDD7840|nr:hypothetical protein [Tsukamurella pulmonis]BDD80335.1 hypothetical protein TPB0596_00980 [Tsukamurella pulmonis]